MGTWRRSGQVVESSAAPKQIQTFSRPTKLIAADGVTKKSLVHFSLAGTDKIGATAQNTPANGDTFYANLYAEGNETILSISSVRDTDGAAWEVYVNGAIQRNWEVISASGRAYQDNGGVWTSYTTAAGNATAADVPLFAAPDTVNDAFYFGYIHPFGAIKINMSTFSDGGSYILEYWDGAAYATLQNYSDIALTNNSTNIMYWDIPTDWATNDPDGGGAVTTTMYYMRIRRLIAFGAVLPVATQVWVDAGYNSYAAAASTPTDYITGLSINPGHNEIKIKVTGQHYSSSDFRVAIGGISIQ